MGVGGCETKTIGYTCRSVVLTVFGPGFNSRRLHHTKLHLVRRVRSHRGGVVLCLRWDWIPAGATPRIKCARGYSATSSEIGPTACVLSALHRVIVMEAGGQKTLPSLCSHRARVSSVFSPPTPHNGSGEMGRTSDTPTCAKTVVKAAGIVLWFAYGYLALISVALNV